METTTEDWVNNECGDFMWDEALQSAESKINLLKDQEKKNQEVVSTEQEIKPKTI
jgi:hypothetical protein